MDTSNADAISIKIIPEIQMIHDVVKDNNIEFICLTEPLNPSGEMYSEEDFCELLRICKKYGCILILDKCQRDELQIIKKDYYFSINKAIYEEGMMDNVVVINSLSKVRSIPGLRIGYVMANEKIIDYIEYMNAITYWHCNSMCAFATAVDVLYQLVFLKPSNTKQYIGDFKEMFKYSLSSVYIAKKIFEYLNYNSIRDKSNRHCCEVIQRYDIIQKNYQLVKYYAVRNGYEITHLDGGFNFCLKIHSRYNEKELKNYASKVHRLELFTQEDFCCKNKCSNNYWVRISCAEFYESFKEKFDTFCEIIEGNQRDNS